MRKTWYQVLLPMMPLSYEPAAAPKDHAAVVLVRAEASVMKSVYEPSLATPAATVKEVLAADVDIPRPWSTEPRRVLSASTFFR
jgi:hypothetical protein